MLRTVSLVIKKAFRTAFHMVSSQLTRDLECSAESSSTPWNPPTILLSRHDCNSTADVPSWTLRTALSAIPFVSDLCDVDVQWFQESSSQDFAKFQRIVSVNDFWFPRRLQVLQRALLGLLRSCCITRAGLQPLHCQILYHHGISVIIT